MNLFDRLIVLDMVTINLVYFGLALIFFKADLSVLLSFISGNSKRQGLNKLFILKH